MKQNLLLFLFALLSIVAVASAAAAAAPGSTTKAAAKTSSAAANTGAPTPSSAPKPKTTRTPTTSAVDSTSVPGSSIPVGTDSILNGSSAIVPTATGNSTGNLTDGATTDDGFVQSTQAVITETYDSAAPMLRATSIAILSAVIMGFLVNGW